MKPGAWLISIFLILAAQGLAAQETSPVAPQETRNGGMFFLHPGVGYQKTSGINNYNRLVALPIFLPVFPFAGISAYGVINNVVIGGKTQGFFQKRQGMNDLSMELKGGYACFEIGYLVAERRGFIMYPLIGAGYGYQAFSMTPGQNNPRELSGFFGNPFTTEQYTAQGWMLNVEFNVDRFFTDRSIYTGRSGFMYGIAIGFTLSPINHEWMQNVHAVPNATPTSFNGAYLALKIGFGGNTLR